MWKKNYLAVFWFRNRHKAHSQKKNAMPRFARSHPGGAFEDSWKILKISALNNLIPCIFSVTTPMSISFSGNFSFKMSISISFSRNFSFKMSLSISFSSGGKILRWKWYAKCWDFSSNIEKISSIKNNLHLRSKCGAEKFRRGQKSVRLILLVYFSSCLYSFWLANETILWGKAKLQVFMKCEITEKELKSTQWKTIRN